MAAPEIMEPIVETAISDEFRSLPRDPAQLSGIREGLDRDGIVELRGFLSDEGHKLIKAQIFERVERGRSRPRQVRDQGRRCRGHSRLRTLIGGKRKEIDYEERGATSYTAIAASTASKPRARTGFARSPT